MFNIKFPMILDLFFFFIMATKRIQPDWSFKILLIGDSGVGKTCLMFRFAGMCISFSFYVMIG